MGANELVEDGSSRDSLARVMEVQHVVSLLEARMWEAAAVDKGLVVTKEDARSMNGYTEVDEGELQGALLFQGEAGSNTLGGP